MTASHHDRWAIAIAVGSGLIGLAPSAAVAATIQNETIVVVGEDEQQRRREMKDFVRELGVANGEKSAARWIDPVCPVVTGLAPGHAAIVASRIRSVAVGSGARVGGKRCEPNIVIAFSGDGGALARSIRSKAPARLSEVPVTDRSSLFEGKAPIRWWYSTEARDSSGIAATSILPPWTDGHANGGGSVLPMNDSSTVLNHYNPSLVSTRTMRALRTATVLVDANQAEGQTLKSVADYVALVALAEIQLDARPANSVLSLFSGPDAPRRMSPRDETFLKALYRLPLDRRSRQQRARLVSDMSEPL